MSCCADFRAQVSPGRTLPPDVEASVRHHNGGDSLTLHVPDITCAACIGRIEDAIAASGANVRARVNFTRKTVTLHWNTQADPSHAIRVMRDLGYAPQPLAISQEKDEAGRELVRCLAVAGFAAMNVMLLSVAVWAGADGVTAEFLNWFAALIALPALAYAARPFIRSALGALRHGRLNMDVPISLAIVLAAALSIARVFGGEGETYFDAAITLTFFLLGGRVLDHMTRERARASVRQLATMAPATAHVAAPDGGTTPIALSAIQPGMVLEVAAGERVPVDGTLTKPASFDLSLATGESRPVHIGAGEEVLAGALALSGPLRMTATRCAGDSFLATLADLQRAAEEARSRPARIADKAARVYAPVVHLLALLTAIGWVIAGESVGEAVAIAIAVLIITCPCALGLAVPAVQVAASDRLFRRGLMLKDGGALERIKDVDEAVFDKTGTLTIPALDPSVPIDPRTLAAAAALARHASHPVAKAVVHAAAAQSLPLPRVSDVVEERGRGVHGQLDGQAIFLGAAVDGEGLVFQGADGSSTALPVTETVRKGAPELIAALKARGLPITILSGDRAEAVRTVAARLGVDDWRASVSAGQKLSHLEARRAAGAKVLMVGDGLNDGPALAAAHASIAPADASDLSRTAADIVMTGESLLEALEAIDTGRKAHRLILQNFAVAAGYNAVAIPLSMAGYATPLLASLAMSTSSIVVTVNALRLTPRPRREQAAAPITAKPVHP
ncbi:MAG: heavy metal translocating P-type ATPase [Pseudomonadota bacterium]